MSVLAFLAFGTLLGLGCGGGNASNDSSGAATSAPTTSSSLIFTVSAPHGSYRRGAAVPITFTVVNSGTQTADMVVGTCFDFVVQVSKGTQQVWAGPSDGCGGVLRPLSIAAGAAQTYNVIWKTTDAQGNAVPSGIYTIVAKFTPLTLHGTVLDSTQLATFTSNPISITIAP